MQDLIQDVVLLATTVQSTLLEYLLLLLLDSSKHICTTYLPPYYFIYFYGARNKHKVKGKREMIEGSKRRRIRNRVTWNNSSANTLYCVLEHTAVNNRYVVYTNKVYLGN